MCAWQVYADSYNTDGELGEKTQKVTFNKNVIIRYIRIWIVVYDDPPFTSLNMKIYSDDNGSKGVLLHTSTNALTKANVVTLDNGVKEIYFTFNDIQLDGLNPYHFALDGSSSGFSASSHIAWKQSWPDPFYRTGLSLTFEELSTSPYDIYFIGAEL